MLSEEQMLAGMAFYGMERERDALWACAEEINRSACLSRVEAVVETLYAGNAMQLETLYTANSAAKMFGEDAPALTPLVVFMLGGAIHEANVRRFHFDEEQIQKQKEAIKGYIRTVRNVGNTTALAWSANLVRGILIEAGVLQFQVLSAGDGTPRVYIHIPGKSLKQENVLRSVEESRVLLARYHGISHPDYWCDSWLLSPGIHALSREDSNIFQFYNLFDVVPGEDCQTDILWNLFHLTDPDAPLPEDTSLQRRVKQAWAEGQRFYGGIGHWKE